MVFSGSAIILSRFYGGKMKRLCLIFCIFLFLLKLFAEDDEDKLRLAVMEFEDKSGKLSDGTLSNATEYIRSAFVASNKFIVIAKERQENAMIKQMKKESYKLCNDKKCQIPLGQALSADTILRTTITFLGGQYTITSELIDLAKEATTKGANATFDGDEKSLLSALDDIVSQIIGRKNKKSEFQQGRFGGKSDDWEIGGGEETIVKFESEPTGAVVIADGTILCQSTPCSKLLTQGNHEIEMQKENYVPNVKRGKITKEKTIRYKLEPDFAWLTVTGNHAASIKLDGQNIGEIPIKEKPISTGNHRLEHTDSCYYDLGENFTVKRGEKKNIYLDLKHRESAIKVYAQDENGNDIKADVYVDNKKVGKAPGKFKVPLCSKKIQIKKNGYNEYSERLSLEEKVVENIHASLERKELRKEPTFEEIQLKEHREKYLAAQKVPISFLVIGPVLMVGGGASFYGATKVKSDYGAIALYVGGFLGEIVGLSMTIMGGTFYVQTKKEYNLSLGVSPSNTSAYLTLNW